MYGILYREGVRDVLIVAIESKTDGQVLIKSNRYLGSNLGCRVLDGWSRAAHGVLLPDGSGAAPQVVTL
jgi:hypothetical protein